RTTTLVSSRAPQATPSSSVFVKQPKEGKNSGFDFYRDPLNSDHPNENPDAIMQRLAADKPVVMQAQRQLLENRYNLQPRLDPQMKMSRGKPLAVGPTARLKAVTWGQLPKCLRKRYANVICFRIRPSRTPCKPMEVRCSRRCKSTCSPGSSVWMWISTCRTSFCRSSPLLSF